MCGRGVSWLPISVGLVMATSVVSTYVIAVLRGDVSAIFPYISDTGIDIPQSSIFSQFFNIAAFLALLTMYLRYKLILELTKDFDPKISRLSKINFVVGIFSCAGLSIVGNFPETKLEVMHIIGAMLVFGCGTLFSYIDTIVSYKMHPIYNGIFICRVRLVIACVSLISFVTTIVSGGLSLHMWYTNLPDDDRQHWKPTDPFAWINCDIKRAVRSDFGLNSLSVMVGGFVATWLYYASCHQMRIFSPDWQPIYPGYPAHLVSTFGEWVMAFSFLLYFFTYIRDFQKFHVDIVPNLYVSNLDDQPFTEVIQHPNESTGLLA